MTALSTLRNQVSSALDTALEATVIGSFTTLGYKARTALFDFDPPDVDLSGQTALVSGGTGGIGRATAAGLMALGATVLITSRDADRAEAAARELNEEASAGSAVGHVLDTGSFASVRALADAVQDSTTKLDMLVHNAGALSAEYRTDDRGTELTLSTHLIGPYLLTKELRDHLSPGARVIWMSSGGMYTQGLDVERIELREKSYKGAVAYARAKRGQVELVTYLAPLWAPEIVMHAMHPGWVDTPGVDAGLPGFGKVMGPTLRSAEEGADTMVWLAATGGDAEAPGTFWLDRRPRRTAYIPGTGTDDGERAKLVAWLDEVTATA